VRQNAQRGCRLLRIASIAGTGTAKRPAANRDIAKPQKVAPAFRAGNSFHSEPLRARFFRTADGLSAMHSSTPQPELGHNCNAIVAICGFDEKNPFTKAPGAHATILFSCHASSDRVWAPEILYTCCTFFTVGLLKLKREWGEIAV
jgi:hypothetical protein